MKHFWTKFLASGLLTLNLSGCLQATDDVKSNPASEWEFYKSFNTGINTTWGGTLGNKTYSFVGLFNGDIYMSVDGADFSQVYDSSSAENISNLYANTNLFIFAYKNNTLYVITGKNAVQTLFKFNTTNNQFESVVSLGANILAQSAAFHNNILFIGTGASNTFLTYDFDTATLKTYNDYSVGNTIISFKDKLYTYKTQDGYNFLHIYQWDDENQDFSTSAAFIATHRLEKAICSQDKIVLCSTKGYLWISEDGTNWKQTYPLLSDNSKNASNIQTCFYNEGLFIFACGTLNSANADGGIFTTTNFDSWNFTPNYTNCGWNSVYFDFYKNQYFLGGADKTKSNGETGRGQLWKADYKSLSV